MAVAASSRCRAPTPAAGPLELAVASTTSARRRAVLPWVPLPRPPAPAGVDTLLVTATVGEPPAVLLLPLLGMTYCCEAPGSSTA